MTIEEMKERKREMGLSNKELSRRSGVPVGTLQKIFSGETKAPRIAAVLALEKVLRKDNEVRALFHEAAPGMRDGAAGMIREAGIAYGAEAKREKKQGEYTLEDYYAIPDERRVELIDGVIYDMSSPSNAHQTILMEMAFQLNSFVKQNHGKCRVNVAPFDVQLDMDDRTMVQPDILVICREERRKRFGCFGAPDMTVEILSPSTSRKDLTIKLRKYMHAGVREYWIVDPDAKQVTVYKNENGILSFRMYDFSDQIPVGIWEDRCLIDLSELSADIDYLNSLTE